MRQQWKALTAVWGEREEKKAAAAEAAAVDWTWLEFDEEAATAKATIVETAGTPEPTVEAAEAEAAAEARAIDWTCFMAAAEETKEEWRQ